jgi:hypothetical protein
MNYFERLIRRALLEAPLRPGAPLRDPFENTAPMTFETPPQPAASAWPERTRNAPMEAPPPSPLQPAGSVETIIERHDAQRSDTQAPGTANPPQPLPIAALPVPAAAASPALAAADSQPLAHADRFMQSIGAMPQQTTRSARTPDAIVPDPQAVRGASPDANDVSAVAPSTAPVPMRRAATIEPPQVPRRMPDPQRSAESEKTPARGDATSGTGAPARESGPRRTAGEAVRETIRIVKVVDAETARSAQMGASPPTFGAGQL